jgi:heterodisulfide reductase subunit A-like polyferredoxin
LAATNPLALDVIAGEMMGLDRSQNPVLLAAAKRGLSPNRLEHVDLIGANINELRIPDFKMPATIAEGTGLGPFNWLSPIFKNAGSLQPRIIKEQCVSCGSCYESCPVDAITMNEVAHIDEKVCIRCYCCHEMCGDEAIELKSSWLYRIINR